MNASMKWTIVFNTVPIFAVIISVVAYGEGDWHSGIAHIATVLVLSSVACLLPVVVCVVRELLSPEKKNQQTFLSIAFTIFPVGWSVIAVFAANIARLVYR